MVPGCSVSSSVVNSFGASISSGSSVPMSTPSLIGLLSGSASISSVAFRMASAEMTWALSEPPSGRSVFHEVKV